MNIFALLDKLKRFDEIEVEQRTLPDGTRQYIVSAKRPYPFNPKLERFWYVLTLPPAGEDNVERLEIEAMLRHLWMYQLGLDEDG